MPESRRPETLAERLTQPGVGSRRVPIDHGHYHIRITRDGVWHYRGTPITRQPLVRLFASVLVQDSYGQYWLQTPVEKGRIDVDDAPFTAIAMEVDGKDRARTITFRTNVGDVVRLDADHPLRIGAPADRGGPMPYVTVRDRLEALLVRPVYYDLVALGENGDVALGENGDGKDHTAFGVWSGGVFFALGDWVDAG